MLFQQLRVNQVYAIIRVSGPLSKKVINNLTGKILNHRVATLVKINSLKNKIIDEGLVVYFPKEPKFYR